LEEISVFFDRSKFTVAARAEASSAGVQLLNLEQMERDLAKQDIDE